MLNLHGSFSKEDRSVDETPARMFTFPGGERHLALKIGNSGGHSFIDDVRYGRVSLTARLTSSDAVMDVLLAVDAIRRINPLVKIGLCAPYIPYARQDRVAVQGEPLSIAVLANLLNSCNFSSVYCFDVHSNVAIALINNIVEIPVRSFHEQAVSTIRAQYGALDAIPVAPDAGAAKRYNFGEEFYNAENMVIAIKKRDPLTGRLQLVSVTGDVANKNLIIYDDICDGGATFVELAKHLKANGARDIHLVVSHGIFSKGLRELLVAGITSIHTTNSIASNLSASMLHYYPVLVG